MLFSNEKRHELNIPKQNGKLPVDIAYLVDYLTDHVMKDSRKELFLLHGSVFVHHLCSLHL
jgi:ubiquitin related modifier 1